jgi:broad specificity phosphatase PhoE
VLYLVRHGRTAHNAGRRLLGREDVPLDELGRRQAEALGQVHLLRNSARVVTSPLSRARETAARLGPPVTIDDRWIELDYGVFDGKRLEEAPELWKNWSVDLSFVPEGGESIAAMAARVRKACDELWEEAAFSDVIVVSHVSPIKAAVAWAIGAGDETSWRMFVDVASVSAIGPGRGAGAVPSPSLRSFNETHFRPSK